MASSIATAAAASLKNKRCLITGASRGIGFAITQTLARAGASCTLVARDPERLAKATAAINEVSNSNATAASNIPHDFVAGDVGDSEFWDNLLFKEPNVDILVNAAGISMPSLLVSTSYASIDQIIRTNLLGTIYGCKAFSRPMFKRKHGCIINLSSVLATQGNTGDMVYAASKAGILGLTKSLAVELGRSNVRVNAICPGYIETDMTSHMNETAKENIKRRTPLQRFGRTDEVAAAALMLATNEFCTGSVITVDGGLSS